MLVENGEVFPRRHENSVLEVGVHATMTNDDPVCCHGRHRIPLAFRVGCRRTSRAVRGLLSTPGIAPAPPREQNLKSRLVKPRSFPKIQFGRELKRKREVLSCK